MDSKNIQNLTSNIPSCLLPIQKILNSNSNSIIIVTQNLNESSLVYGTSSEMPYFVSYICQNFCKTFSVFYHTLHIWYHGIMTNLMIFRLHLLFIEFKIYSAICSWSYFMYKIFYFSFQIFDSDSNLTQ